MRFLFSTLILFFVISSFIKSEKIIKNQLEDYTVFVDILTKKEGTLDLHIPIEEIQSSLNNLQEQLQEEQSQIELFKKYSKTTASIQCGHTQLQPTKKVLKEWVQQKNSLPIDYILFGKKLFTRKIESEDKKIINYGKSKYQQKSTVPPNCEIISINNLSISEMMDSISKYISSDENGIDFKYYQAGQLFEFYRKITFTETQDSTKVVYISKKDTIQTYLFNGLPPLKSINKRLTEFQNQFNKNSKDIGKFSILKGKYGYFKFVSFKNCRGNNYAQFLEKSFKTLNKKKIKYLLVDLRGNTGGQMQNLFMSYIVGPNISIGRYLVKKPKKMFESRYLKKGKKDYTNHKILSFAQKRMKKKSLNYDGSIKTGKIDDKLIFKGKIIIITDEGSFSASSFLACNLKTFAKAKIAGHTAGGSFYKGNAGTLTCILPKSKLTLIVNPNTYFTLLPENSDSQSIKQPDLIIDPIYPDSKKKDEWYINKALKLFK